MAVYGVAILLLTALVAISSQADARGVCAGCPVNQDVSKFSLGKLSKALSTVNVEEGVNKIISVTTQVVAGIKYVVVYESASGKQCTASWVEAEWQSKLPLATEVSCKAKRSLLGGFVDVDPSEMPVVKGFGELAANQNNHNGNEHRRVVVKVLKAQKQIVNGINYKIKYVIKNTACSMDQVPNNDCLSQEVGPKEVCESLVYSSRFMVHDAPQVQVIHTDCQTADSSMNSFLTVFGGLTDAKDSNEVHEAAEFAVQYVNEKVNSMYLKGLYRINEVKSQVVAGTVYHFNLVVRSTDCRKAANADYTAENCHFTANSAEKDMECEIKVWVKPWLGFKKVTESACHSL